MRYVRICVACFVAISLFAAMPAIAQTPLVTITPSGGSYNLNDVVSVSIEYCSPIGGGFFDGPPGVTFNGQNAGFQYSWGTRWDCDDYYTSSGTVQLWLEGANVLETGITNSSGYGSSSATYDTGSPPPPPPPIVSPAGEMALVASPSNNVTLPFRVDNTSGFQDNFSFSVSCTGVVSGCSVSPTGIIVTGIPRDVVVTLSVNGSPNQTGTVTLTATNVSSGGEASGSYTVKVSTSGVTVARELCLTVAVGAGAAYECGDLRLVHPLPVVRTLGKVRAPTLVYNSQHAHPYPLVYANVAVPGGEINVIARLTVNGQLHTRSWPGSQFPAGQTRRVVVGFDALALGTGLYPYSLEIQRETSGGTTSYQTFTGTLPIVNRSGSAFGAGWWLAGLEKLEFPAGGSIMWIGGAGSVRRYEQAGSVQDQFGCWQTVYLAAPVDRPDSLLLNPCTARYYRLLPGGGRVSFATTGYHVATVSPLGHSTDFGYSGTALSTITLPPAGTGLVYYFDYYGAAGTLSAVRAPDTAGASNRVTTIGTSGARIQSIADPAGSVVTFGFDPSYPNVIVQQLQPSPDPVVLNVGASFAFDAGRRLSSSIISAVPGPSLFSIERTFCAAEVRGIAGTCSPAAPDPASVYTRYDGPRTDGGNADTTGFWLDALGAVRQVRDGFGNLTIVTRGDARWPALPTQVQDATGYVSQASYDARGNVRTATSVSPFGTGANTVAWYQWDQKWDAVTSIRTPMGVTTTMAYDAANGNRLWQQTGPSSARRVTFRYGNAFGLLSSIEQPLTPRDSVTYDVRGNVAATRTPRGFWTSLYKDRLGRDTLVVSPIDSLDTNLGGSNTNRLQQRLSYDLADRVIRSVTAGPSIAGSPTIPAETVLVRNFYSASTGVLDSLWRWVAPDLANVDTIRTRWRYDMVARAVAEISPDGLRDSSVYDAASNVVQSIPRRLQGTGQSISMVYDRLNRLQSRSLPQISYAARNTTFNIMAPTPVGPFPAYTIAAETHTFTYDAVGRLLTADNADAMVRRTYYPNGLLERDSLRIQTVGRDNWESHKYGNLLTYDLDGRRNSLAIPQQLAPSGTSGSSYGYDSETGAPSSVSDLQWSSYTFAHNLRGELTGITYPGTYAESFAFDADGRLAADTIRNNGGTAYPRFPAALVRATAFRYDARGRVLWSGDPIGYRDTLLARYSGIGTLVRSQLIQRSHMIICAPGLCPYSTPARTTTVDTYSADALGDRVQGAVYDTTNGFQNGYSPVSSTYQAGTGRLLTEMGGGGQYTNTHHYDAAGNIDSMANVGTPAVERASYFAADGSLRASDSRWAVSHAATVLGNQTYIFEEYRYDALGRRIWTRAQKTCNDPTADYIWATECRTSLLRRTIWDGDQELVEIQMPYGFQTGSQRTITTTPTWWENDVTPVNLATLNTSAGVGDPNPYFGRVIYAGRQGIDQPLAVTRVDYVMALDLVGRNANYQVKAPFTIMPFWSSRGEAPLGVFSNGAQFLCNPATSGTACVGVVWPWKFSAFDRQRLVWDNWHGTLLEGKRDKSGLSYRRNRYYDASTGRFTQEDPIGLAGGMNLYGFANGDPVSFSDPFGLQPCPPCDTDKPTATEQAIEAISNWWEDTKRKVVQAASGIVAALSPTDDLVKAATGVDPMSPFTPGTAGTGERLLAAASAGLGIAGMADGAPVFNMGRAAHIFRQAAGHVNPTTASSMGRYARLFESVAGNPNNLRSAYPGLSAYAAGAGVRVYTQNYRAGQVWVYVRGSEILNAGVNAVGSFR